MPRTLLANKKLGNFKQSAEAFSEETEVRLDRLWQGRQFPVLIGSKVDGEIELSADRDEAA